MLPHPQPHTRCSSMLVLPSATPCRTPRLTVEFYYYGCQCLRIGCLSIYSCSTFLHSPFTLAHFPAYRQASFPVVKWLAVKTASEMTYTVSGGALNSTQTKPNPVVTDVGNSLHVVDQHFDWLAVKVAGSHIKFSHCKCCLCDAALCLNI